MKKGLELTLAGLLVAAVILTAYMWQDLRAQRDLGRQLTSRIAALEALPLTATPSAGAALQVTSPPAAAPETSPPPGAAPAPPARAPSSQVEKPPPAQALLQAMLGSEGKDPMSAMMRSMMAQMYPDVEEELGLTAEETSRLFDLLSGQQSNLGADTMALMVGGADPAATRELQRKLVDQGRVQERQLAAMLGSKYQKWEEYQSTAAARQQVNQLRTTLATSGNPLTEAQVNSLVSAFAGEQMRSSREEREWQNSPAAAESPNMMQESMQRALKVQRKLVEVASPHLKVEQLAQFRRQVEQQERMMQATMGMFGAGAQ